jgi:Protein of unknown function (DUF1573)
LVDNDSVLPYNPSVEFQLAPINLTTGLEMKLPRHKDVVVLKAFVLGCFFLNEFASGQDSQLSFVPTAGVIHLSTSQEKVSLKIPIKNTTEKDFSVTGIEVSCNCTKPSLESEVLRAGQTVNLYTTLQLGGRSKVGSQIVAKAEDSSSKKNYRIVDVQIAVIGQSNTNVTELAELEVPIGGVGVFSCFNRSVWPINTMGIDCDLKGLVVVCEPSNVNGKTQEFRCEVRNVSDVLSPGEGRNVAFTCFTTVMSDGTELKQILAQFSARVNLTTKFRLIPASLRVRRDASDYSLIIDCNSGDAREFEGRVRIEHNGVAVENNWKATAVSENWIRVSLPSALIKQYESLRIRLLDTNFNQALPIIQEN